MKCRSIAAVGLMLGILPCIPLRAQQPMPEDFPIHSMNRPQPGIITPGKIASDPPSDAIVLFNGKDLSAWRGDSGKAAPWLIKSGYVEVKPETGGIQTRDSFADCQLHVEWSAPTPASGEGQERGNSGVFFGGGRYEVQVLDSYKNETYPDGQAGAMFGQYPPLVNPARPPGEWQSYDIIFHGPRFSSVGKLLAPARATVIMNGVVVQDNVSLTGPTAYQRRPPYASYPPKQPILLQDHGMKVRYRNIWLRPLPGPRP